MVYFLPREVESDQNTSSLLITMTASTCQWWHNAGTRIAQRQDRVRVCVNNVQNTTETRLGYKETQKLLYSVSDKDKSKVDLKCFTLGHFTVRP